MWEETNKLDLKGRFNMATFDDFMKLDIRVGTITDAKVFEKARKPAYQLQVTVLIFAVW